MSKSLTNTVEIEFVGVTSRESIAQPPRKYWRWLLTVVLALVFSIRITFESTVVREKDRDDAPVIDEEIDESYDEKLDRLEKEFRMEIAELENALLQVPYEGSGDNEQIRLMMFGMTTEELLGETIPKWMTARGYNVPDRVQVRLEACRTRWNTICSLLANG